MVGLRAFEWAHLSCMLCNAFWWSALGMPVGSVHSPHASSMVVRYLPMRPSDVYEYAKHFPFSAWSSPSLYLERGEEFAISRSSVV